MSPKVIKYVKTAWSQLRGDLGTNSPWSKAAKEDIARALDKYTLFIKCGFDKQQDEVIQLIKKLKKGPTKLKTMDTTHVLSVQENMQNLIRMKFDGTECVDAVIDSGACVTAISRRFFDKLNAYK